MKRHLIHIYCLVIVSLIVSGCSQKTGQLNMPSPSETSTNEMQFEDIYQFAPLEEFAPSGALEYLYVGNNIEGYANEEGFYRTIPRVDGCVNLLYTDFATKHEVYLCNQPNCTHNQTGCTAWFPSSIGSHRPVPIGKSLVMVHGGAAGMYEIAGENVLPRIELMNLNGSERRTACTFGADCLISPLVEDSMARDEKNLYFTIEKYRENETTRLLCAFDVETGKIYCLKKLNRVEEKIVGCDKNKLVLSYVTDEYTYEAKASDLICQIEILDLDSLQVTPLVTQNYLDKGVCYNGLYYVLDHLGNLKSYDLDTREQTNEKGLQFSDEFQLNNMCFDGILDGVLLTHTYLYHEETDDTILSFWAIDLDQENALEMRQSFVDPGGYDSPAIPFAEYNGELLYLSGIEVKPLDTILPDGQVIQIDYRLCCYSMMPAKAYWNNQNVGTPINSSFLNVE